MTYILTFVASGPKKPLKNRHLKEAAGIMKFYDTAPAGPPVWLEKKKAADLPLAAHPGGVLLTHLRDMLAEDQIDLFVSCEKNRQKKLLVADMDSTIVAGETLDDLAEHAGIKEKIAAITRRAMNGELDFKEALRERVGLLKDLETTALDQTLNAVEISPGAETLIRTMKDSGALCVLVSGGFTFFTGSVAEKLGFDHHHGNMLDIEGEVLCGTVSEPILDKHSKIDLLEQYCGALNITPEEALTIGDGANDLPMLKKAGLGIGYRPRPAVAEELNNMILYGDLTAALYAQGIKP